MKKGSLVLLIALSVLLAAFSAQVSGQWAGYPPPGKKRDQSFDEVSSKVIQCRVYLRFRELDRILTNKTLHVPDISKDVTGLF